MKRLLLTLICLTGLGMSVELKAQGDYNLEIEQMVDGTELVMDMYIQKTNGIDFALSSCNFAVFLDTSSLDINNMSKETAYDGPWDNNQTPASYMDMMLGKGNDFLNVTTRRKTTGSVVGYDVTSTRTRIVRVRIPIKNTCGTNSATWNSAPAAQNMMPLSNIKNYANFINAQPNFPLCELPPIPSLANNSGVTEICEGEFVTLATDATATIQWLKDGTEISGATSSTFEVTEAGQYDVAALNCTACKTASANSVTVSVNALPTTPLIEQIGSLLSTDATGTLQWYKDGEIIIGATTATYEPSANGNYTVMNSNSCGQKESDPFAIELTGIEEQLTIGLSAYPNPYKGSTVISFTIGQREDVTIELFDVLGKKLKTLENESKGPGEHNLQFSGDQEGYSEGIYFVKLTIGNASQTLKLVELK